ncbi:MAG: YdeI/OmpD-associated family protein [Pseudanabaena sp.]
MRIWLAQTVTQKLIAIAALIGQTKMNTFYPENREQWREWLAQNHSQEISIWLIYYKKNSGKPSISYSDAVDEALCFGWIDSKVKSIDDEKYMQFFCVRKPNSVWSKVNKEKVASLIEQGLMTKAGVEAIAIAKSNGSWNVLDAVEALVIPDDLMTALSSNLVAKEYFLDLNRTDKRNLLQWITLAKREETRQKRIREIVFSAENQRKPKQF